MVPATDPELAAWMAERAVPLDGVRPDTPEDDLAPVGALLDGVPVVGLGAALPGAHELDALAHRIVVHLVGRGVRTVALGCPSSAATALDDHVRHGTGRLTDVIDRLDTPSWRTAETAALVRALHDRNETVGEADRVRLVGLDPRAPTLSVRTVGTFLRAAAPDALPPLAEGLNDLLVGPAGERAAGAADEVVALLDRDGDALAAATSPRDLARARRHAALLHRAASLGEAGTDAAAERERLMAHAVLETLPGTATGTGTGSPGAPAVAVWAHADHVLVSTDPVPSMGHHLREHLGPGYYALGLVAGSGRFRAVRRRRLRGRTRNAVVHRLGPPPAGRTCSTCARRARRPPTPRARGWRARAACAGPGRRSRVGSRGFRCARSCPARSPTGSPA